MSNTDIDTSTSVLTETCLHGVILSMKNKRGGFTLIELMITVAIIAILAAVAIPKFGALVSRAHEANIRGNLGGMRSALVIYYSDNQIMPAALSGVLDVDRRYIKEIPSVKIPAITVQGNPGHATAQADTNVFDDMTSAAWVYDATGGDNYLLTVNCSHKDSKALVWSSY
jgi:prepilin-type N-terminal cleavage/methylation domain-containing protein